MGLKSSFNKFQDKKPLSRKEAMEAQCYECNGYTAEVSADCKGYNCPLYAFSPWGKVNIDFSQRKIVRQKSPNQRSKLKAIQLEG